MQLFSYDIRFNTFFKKGVPNFVDSWGVYGITGYQGSGKTYYAVYLSLQLQDLNYKYKTNIRSLRIPGVKIEYFEKLEEVFYDTEENCIYVIDEISRRFDKNSKTDKQFYAWLQQSRKRHRIVILITQEWKELPMWLRRPMRYIFTTNKVRFLPLFVTSVGDATNMILDPNTLEWNAPVFKRIVYKRIKSICDLYDTLEPINNL